MKKLYVIEKRDAINQWHILHFWIGAFRDSLRSFGAEYRTRRVMSRQAAEEIGKMIPHDSKGSFGLNWDLDTYEWEWRW